MRPGISRKRFLKLGLVGMAASAMAGCDAVSDGSGASRRVAGMSPGNSASENREALVSALSGSGRAFHLPSGDYMIDNSGENPPKISGFSGRLEFHEGARWVFTDPTRRGVIFEDCRGTGFYGMSVTYRDAPDKRYSPREAVAFYECNDVAVEDYRCDRSPAAGLLFGECVSPVVRRARIENTMADGLHFNNCREARAEDIDCRNTGDDGLAFVNYQRAKNLTGGRARRIHVENSKARGISAIGQSDVLVEEFAVKKTRVSGIICAYESYWNTRMPRNILFRSGAIEEAGVLEDRVNPHGISFYNNDHPNADRFSAAFEDIEIYAPYTRGVDGIMSGGRVRLSNVKAKDAPGEGVRIQGGTLELDDVRVENTGKTGVMVENTDTLAFDGLAAVNTSTSDPEKRAVRLHSNARISGGTLNVKDNRSNPGGYVLSATDGDTAQRGIIEEVRHSIGGGKFVVENSSPALKVSRITEVEA